MNNNYVDASNTISDIKDRDARLKHGGFPKKIGYFGHQPSYVYYDRNRYESSIHADYHATIPREVRIGDDGKLQIINDPKRQGIKINFKMNDTAENGMYQSDKLRPYTSAGTITTNTTTGGTSAVISQNDILIESLARPSTTSALLHNNTYPNMRVPGLTKKQLSLTQRADLESINGPNKLFSSYSRNGPYGEYLSNTEGESSILAKRCAGTIPSRFMSPLPTYYERQCGLVNDDRLKVAKLRDLHYGAKEDPNKPKRLPPFPKYPVLRGPVRMGPLGIESFLTN